MSRSTGGRRGLPSAGVSAPADKRFRRSELRPDRRRAGRAILRVAKWAAPVAIGLAAAVWLVDVLLHANVLAVQQVVVRGNVRLSAEEVRTLVDGIEGENIFQVDFERYRHRVMDSPWVADVRLERVLPATIEVRVTERTPLAIARLGDQLYLVDDSGVIIDEYRAEHHGFDLPVVDGLIAPPSSDTPLVDRDRVRLTRTFLASFASRPDLARRLSHIDVSNVYDVVVMFDNDPAWLHLGAERFAERLKTYLELVPTLQERFLEIDYIDLRFDTRVFVQSRGRMDRVAASVR